MKHRIPLFLFCFLMSGFSLLAFAPAAQAACSGSGSAGDLMYNGDYHVPQYCDGTNWIAMGPRGVGASYAPTSGLVGWWKLDEASGTSAADSSGNGSNGTLTPNATGVWVAGKINNAANLNGTSQYVDVANSSNFNFERTQPFTLAAWIYRNSSADADDEIINKVSTTGGHPGYSFWMPANGVTDPCGNGSADTCTSNCLIGNLQGASLGDKICVVAATTSAAPGAWHHVALTYDGSTTAAGVKIYVDGASQSLTIDAASINSTMQNTVDLLIGQDDPSLPADLFGGKIDDARVYNRALSSTEITALYNYTGGAGCTLNDPPTAPATGLVGWWKLDDGSGTSAVDSSGSGNTGAVTSGTTWTTSGKIGNALTLNGTTQWVDMGDPASLRLAGSWTASTWVKFTSLPASGSSAQLIHKHTSTGGANYGIRVVNTAGVYSWVAELNDTGFSGHSLQYAATISTGVWYLLTGVWDNTAKNLYVYLNGSQVAIQNIPGISPDSSSGYNLDLGSYNNGSGGYAAATLDDPRIYNRALSAAEVAQLYNATGATTAVEGTLMYNNDYHVMQFCDGAAWRPMGPAGAGGGCGAPLSGLVGWWKLDESSGPSAADATGNGNTGTWTNGPTYTASGKINGALTFANASDTYVDVANPANFAFERTNAFTLAAWIYRTDNTTEGNILAKVLSGGNWTGYALWMYPNGSGTCTSNCVTLSLISTFGGGNSIVLTATNTSAATGAWHHVAATYDGSSTAAGVKIYVDGVLQTVVAAEQDGLTASILAATDLKIGTDVLGASDTFTGRIDDARVYNRALSAAEVTQLYTATNPGYPADGGEGAMIYNSGYNVMEYCNGGWVGIGK